MSNVKAKFANLEVKRLEDIKRLVVSAMFSDDELMERLVLKGGNAIDLIHQIGSRASVDVDFSMADDFPQGKRDDYRCRIERALIATFQPAGYQVFDVEMAERPEHISPDLAGFWGGYLVEFKLIEKANYEKFCNDIESLRRNALMLGPRSRFLIDISRFEFTNGKERKELDGLTIFVYSLRMMVCEKLRAICQQMDEYQPVVKRGRRGSARARDFLDIYLLVSECDVDFAIGENIGLLRNVFNAKRVPINLLNQISGTREFHRADWSAVKDSTKPGMKLKEYDFYFDFVVELTCRLKPLWDI